jgi:hypothetical protein
MGIGKDIVVKFERSSMTQDKKEKYIREYITTTRQHFSTYHNHKEQMAYIMTVLYITIAAALVTQKDPEWVNMFAYWYAKAVIGGYSVLSLVFVWWQLKMRTFAADIIAACDSLRIEWLQQFPSDLNVSPTRYKNRQMPAFLKEAIGNVPSYQTTRLPMLVTLGAIGGFAAMLLARLLKL